MLKIEIAKSTACLMLKDEKDNLLDYHFINKYYFENVMTPEELEDFIEDFAAKNELTDYILGEL
ncbi:hypothetical protein [Bacillus xiapuensis]|uniref:Phage protein n=1 Tax=Bacillus xiapuensis TaxID=2014075 RepID=A0ABU6N867_9BACI|nr:hypothetical protein [Bacillus xiapuensis]